MLKINRKKITDINLERFRTYPDVSDIQAKQMLHAIGADSKKERRYKERRFFYSYRNYYDAGEKDRELWDDLVSKELAIFNKSFYHVTPYGIHCLEFLTQCRIYGNYQNVADCKKDIITFLIQDSVYCGYGCLIPTTIKDISEGLAIPYKLVSKTLKILCEEGLCAKTYYGGCDEEGFIHCYHGWTITKKGIDANRELYEQLKKAEYKRIDDMLLEG